MSAAIDRKLAQARERLQNADSKGARMLCQEILARAPRNPPALTLLGISYLADSLPAQALEALERAIAADARNGMALEYIGLAHLMSGNFTAAQRALESAVSIPGAPASVFMRLGIALARQDQHEPARRMLEKARAMTPDDPHVLLNLGDVADRSGDGAAAKTYFEQVLRLAPDSADALFNLGVLALKQTEFANARHWFVTALRHDPTSADIKESLAIASIGLGHFREAADLLSEVLTLDESRAPAHAALAEALFETGDTTGAKKHAERAVDLDKSATKPYATLADVYAIEGQLDKAVASLESGFSGTGSIELLGKLMFQARRVCDWTRWSEAWPKLAAALPTSAGSVTPFSLLCQPLSAEEQLTSTRQWSGQYRTNNPPSPRHRGPGERIRVGYLSSDFYENAVAYLIAEVLELHDRAQFEIRLYSYGPDDRGPMRNRLQNACEHFIEVAHEPDDLVEKRIRRDDLDILVDLKGYTLGARTGLLARRPCPRQVNWLGYPGTMGAEFIDYIIADEFLIPPSSEHAYSERVLRMPHCYQPNDRQRIFGPTLARRDYGLPDDAFVFCCFNQSYKITPEIFAAWMRILHHRPNSVLWLLEDNRFANENLRAAAKFSGIDPARIIFAPKLPLSQHLSRYRTADLALDTFPYTSHTTASDALWGECLLVALSGETFASRVSGSILTAAGFPELITGSLADYEALVMKISAQPDYREALRRKLALARRESALFDSEAFARDLERLYLNLMS